MAKNSLKKLLSKFPYFLTKEKALIFISLKMLPIKDFKTFHNHYLKLMKVSVS